MGRNSGGFGGRCSLRFDRLAHEFAERYLFALGGPHRCLMLAWCHTNRDLLHFVHANIIAIAILHVKEILHLTSERYRDIMNLMMEFIRDDGGRAAAGFKKATKLFHVISAALIHSSTLAEVMDKDSFWSSAEAAAGTARASAETRKMVLDLLKEQEKANKSQGAVKRNAL